MVKLSILIPAYNVETLLPRCLNSIFCQDTADIEVVLVDDGSPDGTFDVAKAYAEKHTNLRVFHKDNEGVGAARNFLLEQAVGEFIWFVDSDDYIVNKSLQQILSQLNNMIDMLGISYNGLNILPFESSGIEYIKRGHINGYLWTKIIRRSVIEDANIRFDPKRYSQEDWFFLMQVYPLLKNVRQVSIRAYIYSDDNENSVMRTSQAEHTRRNVTDSRETICNFKSFINSLGEETYVEVYGKWMNFSVAGYLYSLFPIDYSLEDVKNDLKIFRENNIYPIGRTGRKKVDMFVKIVNYEWIYLLLIKLYRIFK